MQQSLAIHSFTIGACLAQLFAPFIRISIARVQKGGIARPERHGSHMQRIDHCTVGLLYVQASTAWACVHAYYLCRRFLDVPPRVDVNPLTFFADW
jgi:hypothetical protein